MGTGVQGFSVYSHFDELDDPLDTQEGVLSPTTRRSRARANLGINADVAELAVLDGATAGTAVASKAMVTSASNGIGSFRDTRPTPLKNQPAPQTATDTATLTAAQITNGLLAGTPTAAAAYTLPLATALETALLALYPGLANDDSIDLAVINLATTATFAITMTTNTGWTLVGNMVVQENDNASRRASAQFRIRRTAANTYTLYRLS